jgi:predicted amidohydrolase YtcJ
VDCGLRPITAIQDAIRALAARTKTSEGRKLTRANLDAAALNHPVFIEHLGGHTPYVNSLAYRRAEITDHAVDPPGGKFDRDPATDLLGYHGAREANALSLRVYCLMQYAALDKMTATGVCAGPCDDRARVGLIRLVCDEKLYAGVRKDHAAGWQIGTHANGDAAIDIMLRVYECPLN